MKNFQTFFIVGTGRCGTNLLAQVMNAHHRICVPMELQIIFEYSNNGERLAEIFAKGKNFTFRADDYITLIQDRTPHNFLKYYDYQSFFKNLKYPQISLKRLMKRLYRSIADSQGKEIFAEQVPWYGQNIPLLNRLFPSAKFIHLIRDGRDVAISYARTPWWYDDPLINLSRWVHEVKTIEEGCSLLSPERVLTIQYEDLVTQPEEEVQGVCRFLNVEFEASMMDAKNHIDYHQYNKIINPDYYSAAYKKRLAGKNATFFTDSVYAWKRENKNIFTSLEADTISTLKRYGYEI